MMYTQISVKERLKKVENVIRGHIIEKEKLIKNLEIEKKKNNEYKELSLLYNDAQIRVQKAIEETQKQLRISLSPIVTKALDSVFDNNKYEFDIEFTTKGKLVKTSQINFVIKDKTTGAKFTKKLESNLSGGVINLISLALRISLLVISKKSKLLIIDEGMLNLRGDTDTGESYEELAQKFIEIVSKELHMQIIMVTHEPKHKIGNIIDLSNI